MIQITFQKQLNNQLHFSYDIKKLQLKSTKKNIDFLFSVVFPSQSLITIKFIFSKKCYTNNIFFFVNLDKSINYLQCCEQWHNVVLQGL